MGFGILIPILPTFASVQLGASDFSIGFVVAVFSFTQIIFNPLFGQLSDRIGRRPVILASLFLTGISYLIFAYSTTYLLLLLARIIGGIGGSSISVAQAYIADITTKETRVKGMGLIGTAFGLGFVFGPLIGGFLSEYGYAVAGFASSAFSFFAFILALFMLPESIIKWKSSRAEKRKIFDFSYLVKLIQNPNIGIMIIIFFIITFSMANIYGTFSLLGYKYYNFSDQQNGYLFGIMGMVSVTVQGWLINIMARFISEKSLISFGTIFMIIGLGLMPYGSSFIYMAIIVSVLALGTGILQPTILSLISRFTAENEQGLVLGINQSVSAFARVLGPIWGGFAFNYIGFQFPFLTGALFTFFTLLISIFILKTSD